MYWLVMSQANACASQAYVCMYCMHYPMMSQADACSYCTGSVVLISSRIYIYLQLLCNWSFKACRLARAVVSHFQVSVKVHLQVWTTQSHFAGAIILWHLLGNLHTFGKLDHFTITSFFRCSSSKEWQTL
jgi:hypothetical protein